MFWNKLKFKTFYHDIMMTCFLFFIYLFFQLNENLALIPLHHMTNAFESGIKFKRKALKSSLVGNLAVINSFDTKFSCFTSQQTRHQQFLS